MSSLGMRRDHLSIAQVHVCPRSQCAQRRVCILFSVLGLITILRKPDSLAHDVPSDPIFPRRSNSFEVFDKAMLLPRL